MKIYSLYITEKTIKSLAENLSSFSLYFIVVVGSFVLIVDFVFLLAERPFLQQTQCHIVDFGLELIFGFVFSPG